MKFNRKQLEQLTLEKIDEVNDEAGYRKYLEVPEMVEIIATIMEKKIKVFHDSGAKLIQMLRDEVKKLDEENEYLSDFKAAAEEEIEAHKNIINETLRELPVGNISTHTPESIPERVSYYLKELAEYTQRVEAWEKCADDLVDYAHEFVSHLSTWGKNYGRYDREMKQAEDAIEQYLKLKNETT